MVKKLNFLKEENGLILVKVDDTEGKLMSERVNAFRDARNISNLLKNIMVSTF